MRAGHGAAAAIAALGAATLFVRALGGVTSTANDQARSFQFTLSYCLNAHGIEYQPVEREPGSIDAVVPAPLPAEWWVHHGGFGLLRHTNGQITFHPEEVDPNRQLVRDSGSRARFRRALYGPRGSAGAIAEGSCYDLALRTAGFLDESRAATLPPPTTEGLKRVAQDTWVRRAARSAASCMRRRGWDANIARDPEAELRRRFRRAGILLADGTVRDPANDAGRRRAERTELLVASDWLACRRSSGLDAEVDRAWRLEALRAPS